MSFQGGARMYGLETSSSQEVFAGMPYEVSARMTHHVDKKEKGGEDFSPGSTVSAQSSSVSQLIRWVNPTGFVVVVVVDTPRACHAYSYLTPSAGPP